MQHESKNALRYLGSLAILTFVTVHLHCTSSFADTSALADAKTNLKNTEAHKDSTGKDKKTADENLKKAEDEAKNAPPLDKLRADDNLEQAKEAQKMASLADQGAQKQLDAAKQNLASLEPNAAESGGGSNTKGEPASNSQTADAQQPQNSAPPETAKAENISDSLAKSDQIVKPEQMQEAAAKQTFETAPGADGKTQKYGVNNLDAYKEALQKGGGKLTADQMNEHGLVKYDEGASSKPVGVDDKGQVQWGKPEAPPPPSPGEVAARDAAFAEKVAADNALAQDDAAAKSAGNGATNSQDSKPPPSVAEQIAKNVGDYIKEQGFKDGAPLDRLMATRNGEATLEKIAGMEYQAGKQAPIENPTLEQRQAASQQVQDAINTGQRFQKQLETMNQIPDSMKTLDANINPITKNVPGLEGNPNVAAFTDGRTGQRMYATTDYLQSMANGGTPDFSQVWKQNPADGSAIPLTQQSYSQIPNRTPPAPIKIPTINLGF